MSILFGKESSRRVDPAAGPWKKVTPSLNPIFRTGALWVKTRDVRIRVLTWPCRRKVPIFHAESGGAEFKAYKRTGWWENPNAFAGIAGAPFRDNQNARSLQHV